MLHHSLRDFEHFFFRENDYTSDARNTDLLPFWLSLVDLDFFYRIESGNRISSLMPEEYAFWQNFFALNLIVGSFIKNKFKNENFRRALFKHLLLCVYKIDSIFISDYLAGLINSDLKWGRFITRKHPYLKATFLERLSREFQEYLENLIKDFPGIIQKIEDSAVELEADDSR